MNKKEEIIELSKIIIKTLACPFALLIGEDK